MSDFPRQKNHRFVFAPTPAQEWFWYLIKTMILVGSSLSLHEVRSSLTTCVLPSSLAWFIPVATPTPDLFFSQGRVLHSSISLFHSSSSDLKSGTVWITVQCPILQSSPSLWVVFSHICSQTITLMSWCLDHTSAHRDSCLHPESEFHSVVFYSPPIILENPGRVSKCHPKYTTISSESLSFPKEASLLCFTVSLTFSPFQLLK